MSPRWIPIRPGAREETGAALAALASAAAVGTVVFYLTRMILSREPVGGHASGSGTALEGCGSEDG